MLRRENRILPSIPSGRPVARSRRYRSSELGGSQQATCGIDHRPYMGIPMGVHPADHNRPVDSILVCHVPTLSLAAYNSKIP